MTRFEKIRIGKSSGPASDIIGQGISVMCCERFEVAKFEPFAKHWVYAYSTKLMIVCLTGSKEIRSQ